VARTHTFALLELGGILVVERRDLFGSHHAGRKHDPEQGVYLHALTSLGP
jgi:hypothetical protein